MSTAASARAFTTQSERDMDPAHPLIRQYGKLNPYRLALALVRAQLAWDLNLEAWRSRRKLGAWRNRHAGGKAVILCNGPSLLKSDLRLLDGVFTFGLNKINLLFGQSDFRPSCIVAVNPLVIEQNAGFYNHTDIPLFIDKVGFPRIKPRASVAFLNAVNHRRFAKDCAFGINQGNTVTYVAMQLAFHMGFTRVALIGCDHHFNAQGPANMTVVAGARDPDHFSPDYFAAGVKWQLPDLFESEVAYTMAKNMYEAHDRRLVNATIGGRLELLERVSLERFLHE
jgi:hypothetical protein